MPPDDIIYLRRMLRDAQLSLSFRQGRTRASLDDDLLFFYALAKSLENVGEAASHLSEAVKSEHPQIVWRRIIGMRNRLAHAFHDTNKDTLWDTARDDVPVLISQLEAILAGLPE